MGVKEGSTHFSGVKEKVHFWPPNYCPSLILAMQLQNRVSLTIQLSKPVRFGHPSGFGCGFADVDATRRWGPPVIPPFPSPSLFSPLPLLSPCAARCPPPTRLSSSPARQRWPAAELERCWPVAKEAQAHGGGRAARCVGAARTDAHGRGQRRRRGAHGHV